MPPKPLPGGGSVARVEQLRGRNALVTGAAGGIGGYICRSLAAEGVNLALSDLPQAPPQELENELSGRTIDVASVTADIADRDDLLGLPTRAEEAIGPLDILVNCAGLEFGGPFVERSNDEIEALVDVNLTATLLLTRAVLPGMLERGRGHVVNLASMAGKIPSPMLATYSATKHGIVGFTHSLRAELNDSPVGASAICPGFVARAGMFGRLGDVPDPPPPMRPIQPEEVAEAVITAIRHDEPEIIVNGRGTKALIVFRAIAPKLFARVTRSAASRNFADEFAAAKEAAPETPAEQKVHAKD
jgi:short-subunit dehydrogenase